MVTARRLFVAIAAALVLLLAVGGLLAWRSWSDGGGPGLGEEPIVGSVLLEPEQHLFADAIHARVELIVDNARVDPDSVDVGANFAPYRELRPVERTRSDSGEVTKLRFDYLIGCLTARCLPTASGRVDLGGAAINYRRRGSSVADAATLEWQPLRAVGRIDPAELEQAVLRAELRDLPEPSYRVSPKAIGLIAVLLAVLFAGAAAILVLRLLPIDRLAAWFGARRVDRRSALEQALALVRDADSPEEGRRALERLAVELRRSRNAALAQDASRLAWSRSRPVEAGVGPLSEDVQRVIAENGQP